MEIPKPVALPAAAERPRVTPSWLALREPADAAARAVDLVELARPHLDSAQRLEIHDLGCGTGAMARWLAPRLAGPQHWVLYDRDADLLAVARECLPPAAAGGGAVTAEVRRSDITRLGPDFLVGASLVTASSLLDLLTVPELARVVAACVAAECPVLIGLSVVGQVTLAPGDPLDRVVARAFNAHQRRTTDRGRLLGPAAVAAADGEFKRHGWHVHRRRSPWRLGGADTTLVTEWFTGWVAAAREQRPELAGVLWEYADRRLAEAGAGQLRVTVGHEDLLALPR